MLLSFVTVSAVCLALAYSGWDGTDLSPEIEMTNTNMNSKLDMENLGQWRESMLTWLLLYDEDSDAHRDCCGMTLPRDKIITSDEKQTNNTNKVLQSAVATFGWKSQLSLINHHDMGDIHPKTGEQNSKQKSPNIHTYKPTNIGKYFDPSSLYDNAGSVATDPITIAVYADNSTSLTGGYLDYSLNLFPDWSPNLYYLISYNNNNNTTYDKHHFEEKDDDFLSFLMIPLLLATIVYKYGPSVSDKTKVRLPKGTTKTPVLYRKGKHLELGLSKYLKHRSVSKSQIISTYSFCLPDVDWDRPGLGLTHKFNPDFQNPCLESKIASYRSYFGQNLSSPVWLQTPSPFLPLKNLYVQEEVLLEAANNLSVMCERDAGKLEAAQPQSSNSQWESVEAQLTQLGHNINYLGSNTTYYEKTSLLLAGLLIQTLYRTRP